MNWAVIVALGIAAIILLSLGARQLWKKHYLTRPGQSTSEIKPNRPKPQQPPQIFGSGCLLTFGLAWTSLSLVFVVVGIGLAASEWTTYSLLREHGVTTEGEIISRRVDEDADGATYYVTYAYTAPLPQGDRDRFVHEEAVRKQKYQQLPLGTPVDIRYAANHPETARLADKSWGNALLFSVVFALFGGLFTLLGITIVSGGVRGMADARKLAYRGVTTQARIIERWTDEDSDGDPIYCVSYRFTVPGYPDVFKAEINRKAYELPDNTLPVRYVPDKPEICRLAV